MDWSSSHSVFHDLKTYSDVQNVLVVVGVL